MTFRHTRLNAAVHNVLVFVLAVFLSVLVGALAVRLLFPPPRTLSRLRAFFLSTPPLSSACHNTPTSPDIRPDLASLLSLPSQMNIRPDFRHNTMNHLPQGMLAMNSSHIFPSQQQQQQQQQRGQQQQPAPPPHMGLLPNGQNPNLPLAMLQSGQPNAAAGSNVFQVQMQQVQRQQQQLQHQGLNAPNASAPPHVNGIGHSQLQGMAFPNSMMQQSSLRRVPSQPLVQSAPSHIPGIHSNQPVVGAIPPMGGMPLNPQVNPQLRQVPQQQQMRMQQQPPHMQGSHVSPDYMNRQAHMQNSVGLQANIGRTLAQTQQSLGGLAQSGTQAHSGMMQQSMQPPSFQNTLHMAHSQPPPQLSSSPRAPNIQGSMPSNMSSTNSGPTLPSTNRTPDNAMFFQNSQIPQNMPHNTRLPPGNAQFAFAPSSTPPNHFGDISQSLSSGSLGTPGSAGRAGLMTTPAQAFEQMNQGVDHFPLNHPMSAPPRPASQHATNPPFPMPSQQAPQRSRTPGHSLHSSPRQPDHSSLHMQSQRPQSQPQVAQAQSPQAGPSRTPHVPQVPLPGSSTGPLQTRTRHSPTILQGQQPAPGASSPSSQAPSTPIQGALTVPRQPASTPANGVSSIISAPGGPSDITAQQNAAQMAPVGAPARSLSNMTYPVGFGQGLMRLLQFSGVLANDNQNKLQLSYWDSLIKEYFTPKASLKFTLWKDNQRNEAKPFEIGVPILPRFFLVTSQSGVKSMNLTLDGARERIVSQGHAVVECVHAIWTYRYNNGYTVTLRGPMTAHIFVSPNYSTANPPQQQHVTYTLKFDQLQFDANYHDKLIAMESIGGNRTQESPRLKAPSSPVLNGINGMHMSRHSEEEDRRYDEPRLVIDKAVIPAEPVNAFGIPQATMRCLELAESVAQMSPLIQFSTENKLGPLDALTQYARKLRDSQGPGLNGVSGQHGLGFSPSGSGAFDSVTGVPATPPVTLYPGTPLSSTTQAPSSATASTPNGSVPGDGPKQSKPSTSVQQSQPPATPTSGSAAASTPASVPTPTATSTTPSMAHSTLKRKAQGEGSNSANSTPEVATTKRPNRKRGRTGG